MKVYLWDGSMMSMLRTSADLTQTDIAERLDVSQNTVQSWESDRTQPRGDRLLSLAELLKVEPHTLFASRG